MRFSYASPLSLLLVGTCIAVGWSCGAKDQSSTFATSGSASTSGGGPATSGAGGNVGTGSGTSGTSSTAAGTQTGVIMTTGTTGSGGTGVVDLDAANCGTTTQGTKQIPIDVFIMQDKSGSMECPAAGDDCPVGNQSVAQYVAANPTIMAHPTRWEATTTALNGFAMSPMANGIGIGIGFFAAMGGNNAECNILGYATPTVPIAPLPGNAMAFTAAVGATAPAGGTPTTPALTGAIQYAQAYTTMQAGARTAAVLFVTDGLPSDNCNPRSNPMNATAAAAAGFAATPSIKTFVVGLGSVATLDTIALAGVGGNKAACPDPASATCYIPATGDVTAALTKALTTITGMITCNYAIPTGSDPRLVNVQTSLGAGMTTAIGKVDSMTACGASGGWFYDNNTTPTQIILCPQSCDPLKATANSGVQVVYGCPSNPAR